MKSKVYWIPVRQKESVETVAGSLKTLIDSSNLFERIRPNDRAALKIHFGEEGNRGYVQPDLVRVIADAVAQREAIPLLSDTNTLYRGRRTNSADHQRLAYEHGFTKERVHADVVIPDDTQKGQIQEVSIQGKYVKTAYIARFYYEADFLIAITHFKGHMMTGFGGSIKNIGMGCAGRQGKLAQHSDIAPFVIKKKCTGCGACVKVCPVLAIVIQDKKSEIDQKKCIGCASCIAACKKFNAIEVDWGSGSGTIQEKMSEYAHAVLQGKKERSLFLNFCTKITQECDCLAKDDPRIAPDVGIVLSDDPVAADKASYDLVLKTAGKDVFHRAHPGVDGMKQIRYAQSLGMGSGEYELIEVRV